MLPMLRSTAPMARAALRLQSRQLCVAGKQSHENLKTAFAGASMNYRRYMYFAQKADIEGNPEVASLLRSIAEGEAAASMGHMEFLENAGDPATNEPIGDTESNLKAAIASEMYEASEMYPQMAQTARSEGLDDVADWFDVLAQSQRNHAGRFNQALHDLKESDR